MLKIFKKNGNERKRMLTIGKMNVNETEKESWRKKKEC